MKLSKIMDKNHIFVGLNSMNKRQLLEELAEKASKLVDIDERTIFDALLERENLGSTGFGSGTAVPHARMSKLNNIVAILAKIEKPIDFNSVDGNPIDLAFLLLSPEGNGADHLTVLAKISRILKDVDLCNKIRKENNPEKILTLLDDAK